MSTFQIWVMIAAVDVVITGIRGWRELWWIALAGAAVYLGLLIWNAVGDDSVWALGDAAAVAYYLWLTWHNRPRGGRRKASKLIGAKARAIRDKLVAAMPGGSAVPVPA